jgi:small nuclear ribonucleoprotein (snRNP)-like protein
MKKIMTLIIGVSLLFPSGALFAKERRGAQLVIKKTNGTEIRGELIGVKQDSTLLLGSSSGTGEPIDLSGVKTIKIVKGSIWVAGVIVGLVGGGVTGQEIGRLSGPMGARPLGGIIGGLVGGFFGGVIASHNDEILIEGKSQEQIKAFLEKLRKKARFPDYQ